MVPDSWFVKELWRQDPNLVVVWHPKKHRWQIRHWLDAHPAKPQRSVPFDVWRRKTALIRTVCYRDEEFYDIGFHPLDSRVLYALKLSRKLSLNPEQTARMVDESNKKIEDEWQRENNDIAREVAKSIYHHYREPSVDLGQKSPY